MSSIFGDKIKISIFGQSHSKAIGVTFDGLESGFKIDFESLQDFLNRRAPGQNEFSTPRKELDEPEFISGLVDGVTCGAPLTALIYNKNTRSSDYNNIVDIPRPSHADYTANIKYNGYQDVAGGGHFSGRLTAPLCVAGGIAKQILKSKGIEVFAHISSIKTVKDDTFDKVKPDIKALSKIAEKDFPVLNDEKGELMKKEILTAKENLDSVGGTIECVITGLKAGIGNPNFDGIENRISSVIFGIPAVKGIEFGNGFDCEKLYGSENNDEFYYEGNSVLTKTNNCGGILGGISNGLPIYFKTVLKPTPSISKSQNSISLKDKKDAKLSVKGRHDPCIVARAVPCIEAAAAIAILDLI